MKTRLNMPGFKLKHMSALPVKKYKEAEEPKIQRPGPQPPMQVPEGEGKYNAAFNNNHVVGSSGGNNDEELNKFLEGIHEVDNPEYTDPNNPEYEAPRSTEHDFFIKNRSKESDSIAKVFMNLDKDARRLRSERNFKAAGEKQNEINDLLKYIKNENANRIKK